MPELLGYFGRTYTVEAQVGRACDTISRTRGSALPGNTVLLDDLRCDGSGHERLPGGLQDLLEGGVVAPGSCLGQRPSRRRRRTIWRAFSSTAWSLVASSPPLTASTAGGTRLPLPGDGAPPARASPSGGSTSESLLRE